MKPMLMTETAELPEDGDWSFEVKYDGFRCLLYWTETEVFLYSRNERLLNDCFPEIIEFCEAKLEHVSVHLPLLLDGEIVHLLNDYRSEFHAVQTRGRMRSEKVIQQHVQTFPCEYIAFDLLKHAGKEITGKTYEQRKEKLKKLFTQLELPVKVKYRHPAKVQAAEVFEEAAPCWDRVLLANGEGVIAKKRSSEWLEGKRTENWLKYKNWRKVHVVLTSFDKENGFFTGAVYREDQLAEVVTFRHGLSGDEEGILQTFFYENGKRLSGSSRWIVKPSVCAVIHCIDFDGKHLREPRFDSFALDVHAEQCTWQRMYRELYPLPPNIEVTHPEKCLWKKPGIKKEDYLLYLQLAAPYLLPFLQDRLLTVIRYPHGTVSEERFFQKNAPDYTPAFVRTVQNEGIDYIVCDTIETLLWLGNQLALEFHIPFQTVRTANPTEIVFDLDPPSVEYFSLAVEAAVQMKAIFDQFQLQAFVKTSGNKGLQLYIPLPYDQFSYEDTRVFTKFVCDFLCEQEPQWFTTERLKKNRGTKLYLDYVQHQEGKTIIAPYSPRGNTDALVATPLDWSEVTQSLQPSMFSIYSVLERLETTGDLFRNFSEAGEKQPFQDVLNNLKGLM
nr:DNA ligase D [Sporosarcina cascadiensis]